MALSKHYKIDSKISTRRVKPVNIVVVFLALLLVAVGGWIFYLRRDNNVVVDSSNNTPIAGVVESAQSTLKTFKEPEYILKLPENWGEELSRKDQYYDYIKYETTDKANTGRSLSIYKNYNRDLPSVTRILPVEIEGDNIFPMNVSPQCYTFTDFKDAPLDEPVLAKWENVEFMCNPNKLWHVVGVGEEDNGFGIDLGDHHFTFIYTDHSAMPNDSIFLDILRNFEAR